MAGVLPPLPIVVFLQSAISFILFLPLFFKNGGREIVKILYSRKLKFQFFRTVSTLYLSYSLFYAVHFIPLVNAMLLVNTAPLMMPFVAYLIFSQRIDHSLWIPMIIGFVGVVIVLNPDPKIFHWASLLALGGGLCMALGMILIRKASVVDSVQTTMFYFLLFSTVISGVIAIPFWQPLATAAYLPLFTIGLLYFFVQCAASYALKFANPQLVSTLFYSNIIFAAIISALLWHTAPSLITLLGVVLIVSGGILCIHAEYRSVKQIYQDESAVSEPA